MECLNRDKAYIDCYLSVANHSIVGKQHFKLSTFDGWHALLEWSVPIHYLIEIPFFFRRWIIAHPNFAHINKSTIIRIILLYWVKKNQRQSKQNCCMGRWKIAIFALFIIKLKAFVKRYILAPQHVAHTALLPINLSVRACLAFARRLSRCRYAFLIVCWSVWFKRWPTSICTSITPLNGAVVLFGHLMSAFLPVAWKVDGFFFTR